MHKVCVNAMREWKYLNTEINQKYTQLFVYMSFNPQRLYMRQQNGSSRGKLVRHNIQICQSDASYGRKRCRFDGTVLYKQRTHKMRRES